MNETETKSKWTRGPYRVGEYSHGKEGELYVFGASHSYPIARLTGDALAGDAALLGASWSLLEALKDAVSVIRTWHGLRLEGGAEEALWELYQSSPEMQRINAAIALAEKEAS